MTVHSPRSSMTAEELFDPADDVGRLELVEGELVHMTPTGRFYLRILHRDVFRVRLSLEEVVRSIPAYKDAIQGKALAMVVTNAADFTNDAVHLAKQEGVQMIARDRLRQLQTWK